MGAMASQISSLTIFYSTVFSGTDQRKHQTSALLAFVRGIRRSAMASNVENVSIWWRHHDAKLKQLGPSKCRDISWAPFAYMD